MWISLGLKREALLEENHPPLLPPTAAYIFNFEFHSKELNRTSDNGSFAPRPRSLEGYRF